MLISLELDNISRNINGVLTGFSCTFVEENKDFHFIYQPDVKDTLHKLHANYVLVPADKAANNVIIECKKYYIDTLVK